MFEEKQVDPNVKTESMLKDLLHVALGTDKHGNLVKGSYNFDSDTLDSGSTLYLAESETLKKNIPLKRQNFEERLPLKLPVSCKNALNDYCEHGSEGEKEEGLVFKKEFVRSLKNKRNNLKKDKAGNIEAKLTYDWKTWESQFNDSVQTSKKDTFYYHMKLPKENVEIQQMTMKEAKDENDELMGNEEPELLELWGTRKIPGIKRIKKWIRSAQKERKLKKKVKTFEKFEDFSKFLAEKPICQHIAGNIYHHRYGHPGDFESEDFCKDDHSEGCQSFKDDLEPPRILKKKDYLRAAQCAFHKTFPKRIKQKPTKRYSDPATIFRINLSKYLNSDKEKQVAEDKFNIPTAKRTKFSNTMPQYITALRRGNAASSSKKDYASRYRGILEPQEIVTLEEKLSPRTEMRNNNLQECIKSWIEKPSYINMGKGDSLVDTPGNSSDEEVRERINKFSSSKKEEEFRIKKNDVDCKPEKYKHIIRKNNYVKKLDVNYRENEVIVICLKGEPHYVGRLKTEDIQSLIDAAERHAKGTVSEAVPYVQMVAREVVPLVIELLEKKNKKVELEEELDNRVIEDLIKECEYVVSEGQWRQQYSDVFGNYSTIDVNNHETNEQISRFELDNGGSSKNKDEFKCLHRCTASKRPNYEVGRPVNGASQRPFGLTLKEKLVKYIYQSLSKEMGEIMPKELINKTLSRLANLPEIQCLVKMKNDYKYATIRGYGKYLLNSIPRSLEISTIFESIPDSFTYNKLTDYRLNQKKDLLINKVVNLTKMKKYFITKYRMANRLAKQIVKRSIKNSISLSKRKALIRILCMSVDKSLKINKCMRKKRKRVLKDNLKDVNDLLRKEKHLRKSLYLSLTPNLNFPVNEFRIALTNLYKEMRDELFAMVKPQENMKRKRKWFFKIRPKVVKSKSRKSAKIIAAKYNKNFGVLFSSSDNKVLPLPKYKDCNEKLKFKKNKSIDISKKKRPYVVRDGHFLLKGCEKVVKKCYYALELFGIRSEDLESALVLYSLMQMNEPREMAREMEMVNLADRFTSLKDASNALENLVDLEDQLKRNEKPNFITWQENDEDYHLKTYVAGDRNIPSLERSSVNNRDKTQFDEYKFYNYKTDHNYGKANDYSSEEGDSNENHYIDNLCSCGVRKELHEGKKSCTKQDDKTKEVQIELEMVEDQEKENDSTFVRHKVNKVTITGLENSIYNNIDTNNQPYKVDCLGRETMNQFHRFLGGDMNNMKRDQLVQIIDFIKAFNSGSRPELRFETNLQKDQINLEPAQQIEQLRNESEYLDSTITKHSSDFSQDRVPDENLLQLADKYFYTENLKPKEIHSSKNVFSTEYLRPRQLERAFHYSQKLNE